MVGAERFYQQAASLPLLTADQEKAIGAKAFAGDRRARNRLVRHNIRLCHKVAAYYAKKNVGMEEEDLIQVGIDGLIHAAERFDPAKGNRFSTYAMWWIRQRIRRYIEANHSRVMRIPASVAFEYFTGRMTGTTRAEYEAMHFGSLSIDAPVRGTTDDARMLGDTIHDQNPLVEQRVVEDDLYTRLGAALGDLTREERDLIIARYGLDGSEPATLEELAETHARCRTTIRDIIDNALNQLREDLE